MPTLAMWAVYDRPADYPDKYVARRFEVDGSGPRPTHSIIVASDLNALRAVLMLEMYLTSVARSEGDDPKIVETWM
jgi:hypothetical protein